MTRATVEWLPSFVSELSFSDNGSRKRDKWIGFVIASLIHVLILWAGNASLMRPVEYGVEAGMGGIEVSLVAAPVQEEIAQVVPAVQEVKEEPVIAEDDLILPQAVVKPEHAKVVAANVALKGDGSSAVPGTDPTTLYSQGGAMTQLKPNYLRNPAPRYPEQARKMGQQGLVLLSVSVSQNGRPMDIRLTQSSGFPLLDEAALRTVKKWKFEPARLGSLRIESRVEIPIRFELKGQKK